MIYRVVIKSSHGLSAFRGTNWFYQKNRLARSHIIYWSWDFKFPKLRSLWNTQLSNWNPLMYVWTTYYYCVLTSFWPHFTTAQEALDRAQWYVFKLSTWLLSSGQDFDKNFLDSKHVLKVYFKPIRKNLLFFTTFLLKLLCLR